MSYFETGDIADWTVMSSTTKHGLHGLGACCAGCAGGTKKCGGGALGSLLDRFGVTPIIGTATPGTGLPPAGPGGGPFAPPSSGISPIVKIALVAGVVGGGVFLYRRYRAGKPKSNR